MDPVLGVALAWSAGASIVGFLAMGLDKRRARLGRSRVPERTLLLLALAGGSPGVLAGVLAWRHKTRKPVFLGGLAATVALQAGLAWWIWG